MGANTVSSATIFMIVAIKMGIISRRRKRTEKERVENVLDKARLEQIAADCILERK